MDFWSSQMHQHLPRESKEPSWRRSSSSCPANASKQLLNNFENVIGCSVFFSCLVHARWTTGVERKGSRSYIPNSNGITCKRRFHHNLKWKALLIVYFHFLCYSFIENGGEEITLWKQLCIVGQTYVYYLDLAKARFVPLTASVASVEYIWSVKD